MIALIAFAAGIALGALAARRRVRASLPESAAKLAKSRAAQDDSPVA